MSIITLTSDFGHNSIYIATSKAYLIQHLGQRNLIDLYHSIEPCDIVEAAYIFKTVINNFPPDTIHVVAVDAKKRTKHAEILVARFKSQYLVGYNSGLLGMIAGNENIEYRLCGNHIGRHFTSVKEAFGPAILELVEKEFDGLKRMDGLVLGKKVMQTPVVSESHILGNVMFFDVRGTAYTNIEKNDFDKFVLHGAFEIKLTKHESIKVIQPHLADLDPGSPGAFFNDAGYLCIGIYHDDTRSMLAFKKGHVIIIEKG